MAIHFRLEDNDDSWEVRAFHQDTTGNLLGSTWPPRSYTCTFCRRDFRSAQALGGHMNVHRRDRARLHEAPPPTCPNEPPLFIPSGHKFVTNGLCLLYPLHNPNTILIPNPPMEYFQSLNKPNDAAADSHSSNTEQSRSNSNDDNNVKDENTVEELDLELRLGRKQR